MRIYGGNARTMLAKKGKRPKEIPTDPICGRTGEFVPNQS